MSSVNVNPMANDASTFVDVSTAVSITVCVKKYVVIISAMKPYNRKKK